MTDQIASCPNCVAVLPRAKPGAPRTRCPECGATLRAGAPKVSRDDEGGLTRSERVEANREIARAMKSTSELKNAYWVLASFTLLLLLLCLLLGAPSIILIGVGFVAALTVAGALNVERDPVPWSLVLAVTWTGLLPLLWPALSSLFRIAGAVIVVLFWGAFAMARRAQRLIEAHPELRLARRARGQTIDHELSSVGTKHRDRARAEQTARGEDPKGPPLH